MKIRRPQGRTRIQACQVSSECNHISNRNSTGNQGKISRSEDQEIVSDRQIAF